jgi:lycopene cyclase domain-containing protein
MKNLYLAIDLLTIAVPFLFSFHPKLQFYKHWKAFFSANLVAAAIFIAWDVLFTHWKVWGFNPNYVTGYYLVNLPMEEVLFFICIPFSCVFTYHCLNNFFKFSWKERTEKWVIGILSLILILFGILYWGKAYTSATFISFALFILLLKFVLKVTWLPKILSIYPVLLIPFFIVNGILTGTGLEAPVVWYDDLENLGIRMGTIPVEDVFYGLELILLNLFLYEKIKR